MSDLWGSGRTTPPAVTDPVVVDGIRYRIREIARGEARCRTSFQPIGTVTVAVSGLRWDRIAGVWRLPGHEVA